MSSAHLLTLPRELRDHIWSLTFQNITLTPFPTQNRDWFFYPARRQCRLFRLTLYQSDLQTSTRMQAALP
jgi:hypothetical protein